MKFSEMHFKIDEYQSDFFFIDRLLMMMKIHHGADQAVAEQNGHTITLFRIELTFMSKNIEEFF